MRIQAGMDIKVLFLIFHGFNPANGISKKIHYQVKALEENGMHPVLCYLSEENGHKRRIAGNEVIADYGTGIRGKILKRTVFSSIVRYAVREKIRWVYIRSDHNANPFTIALVRRLKKNGIRCIMEIPTYPYDREYQGGRRKIRLWIDRCFRKRFASYLDYIVTFSGENRIFGIPAIRISNGVDFSDIPLKKRQNVHRPDLHCIGVAEIHRWHGYDRLLKGMTDYYRDSSRPKIYFHLVGEFFSSQERDEMLRLISNPGLRPYVILHGALHGKALDDLFEECDMGIGSLGRHRSGITTIKTLKNREYAARGIPFIYSENDEDFEDKPYIQKIPADETPVSIPGLITFYNQLQISPAEIRASISSLSWAEQMKKVTDTLAEDFRY